MLEEMGIMKKVKDGCDEGSSSPPREAFKNSNTRRPSWLQSTLDDMDRRMKMLVLSIPEGAPSGDTFKERAEYYYEKRPQLLALLQELYIGYLALSDKYIQTLAKQNRHGRQSSLVDNDFQEDSRSTPVDSDAESSVSYQPHHIMCSSSTKSNIMDADLIVAELVIKNVELDIMVDEVTVSDKRYNDSARKIELQKSLLEVLESERLILLNENAKLCCQVSTLMEENKELEYESSFVKRKASEMARCLIKMREEQRVVVLNQKIDNLLGEIQTPEKEKSKELVREECYDQMAIREQEVKIMKKKKKKIKNGCDVNMKFLHHIHKLKLKRESSKKIKMENSNKRKIPKWWAKVKNMDFFVCGSQPGLSS